MDKLIIVNCAADTSMHPDVPQRFSDSKVLADSVEEAVKAGAAVAHIHAPPTNYAAWESHSKTIRDRCDVMLQYGISTQSVEQRVEVIKNKPEMISVALNAHSLVFLNRDMMMLHPREELEDLMRMCNDNGVKPEFEVFGLGEMWLLSDLAEKGLVEPPFVMTIFFGRPGGCWSPATPEEFLNRTKSLIGESAYITSVTDPNAINLHTMAIMDGGHVRVGTEDEPYLAPGKLGDNGEHVARVARLAKDLNREIATVAEARAMLKIPS
ncbi:MAG: 3-keto-5-aminohexanoate cleavage protein [Nitrospinaceae bacterium]|nr:3-keto-5-aminohexanoate cleavage protein [Nitrospinaceae bacterium]MBT3435505.1 3-keto-5-aminohexanoate cleavage protein [Nitrospinaceae bacterium]MBT3821078.1 3-keto-5-aminohexanoate cleavage protein [Nitrospinaceae bacterium]MBT4095811.1 3-keto-5-aminohexanoate cleavage protein [Nitrospinaceae bacterium]MBT4432425.1 3-keto-5-aminohexanoate cleavage protein [Nitrospinaceae bacterium]